MGRYFSGSVISGNGYCCINGRTITFDGDDLYVDGILYVPADEKQRKNRKGFTPDKVVDRKFDVNTDFDMVSSNDSIDVTFRQSNDPKEWGVTARFPENYIDKIMIKEMVGCLHITTKPGVMINLPEGCGVNIVAKNLNSVKSGGSGNFKVIGDLNTNGKDFHLESSGSGNFECGNIMASDKMILVSLSGSGNCKIGEIKADFITIKISGSADMYCGKVESYLTRIDVQGSGHVEIEGKADSVEYNVSGSGSLNAVELHAESGKASVTGSGDIRCDVEVLSERVRGSGDIYNRHG